MCYDFKLIINLTHLLSGCGSCGSFSRIVCSCSKTNVHVRGFWRRGRQKWVSSTLALLLVRFALGRNEDDDDGGGGGGRSGGDGGRGTTGSGGDGDAV